MARASILERREWATSLLGEAELETQRREKSERSRAEKEGRRSAEVYLQEKGKNIRSLSKSR